MGRMKEIYMQVMHANDGQVPGELTISDMIKMKELEIYNWEEYEREQERIRVFRVKQENPREITKVAQTREYWEQELRAGQNRRKIKKDQQ
jgi:hypothetical protein